MKVLVIAPDSHVALLIGEMLRSTWSDGLVVAHTERLDEGIQQLLDQAASCVLLDLPTPGTDPLLALEQLWTAAPQVPILVLFDRDDEEQALRAIRARAQDHLVKSELQPARLRRAVKYAIERKRTELQLAQQALHDPLTALPNRALFMDRLGVALDRSRRTRAPVAVLFVDVDNFKRVNDTFGHAAGDRVLASLAQRLRTMLRPMDTVARFGGDEFMLLFEDLESEREVVLIAERISRATSLPIRLERRRTSVTVSIGIAMVADPAIAAATVIQEADAAMYRAKELGPSRYELFDESSRRRAMERLELEEELRHALERSQLRVHYQPNVSLADRGVVTGVEALVRWEHPDRGLIGPNDFIPLAEATGMMIPIGQHVLEQALRQIARWRRLQPEMTISVNVSFRQLEDMSLSSTLAGAIRGSDVAPEALCLEVSESALSRDPQGALRALQALKAMGVRLAIDDFGTGASSLSNIINAPIDTLKLHETLVRGLGHSPQEGPVVGAVVDLGHALGLNVVAEGVETAAQLDELRMLGCDGAQGFLLGRPVPEEEVQALLLRTADDRLHARSGP